MATSISGPVSGPLPIASSSPSVSPTPQPAQQTAAPSDTVKLSQSAQVLLLQQQGQTPSQIATNLSIPIADVDGYLGIPVSVSTPTPIQSTSANAPASQ